VIPSVQHTSQTKGERKTVADVLENLLLKHDLCLSVAILDTKVSAQHGCVCAPNRHRMMNVVSPVNKSLIDEPVASSSSLIHSLPCDVKVILLSMRGSTNWTDP
jgi:hypothetical protein